MTASDVDRTANALCEMLDLIDEVAGAPEEMDGRLPELIASSEHPNRFARMAVAELFGVFPNHVGKTRDHLLRLAADPDVSVRHAAIASLQSLRDDHADTLAALLGVLRAYPKDHTPAVALGAVGGAIARRALIGCVVQEHLESATAGLHFKGRTALKELKGAIDEADDTGRALLLPFLFKATRVSEPEILRFIELTATRTQHVAIMYLKDEDVSPVVLKRLCEILVDCPETNSWDPYSIRHRAMFLIARMGSSSHDAVSTIVDVYCRSNGEISSLRAAVGKTGSTAIPFLVAKLEGENHQFSTEDTVHRRALAALGDAGVLARVALPSISNHLSSSLGIERAEACLAFLRGGGEFAEVRDLMVQMLNEPDNILLAELVDVVAARLNKKGGKPQNLVDFAIYASSRTNNWRLQDAVKGLD